MITSSKKMIISAVLAVLIAGFILAVASYAWMNLTGKVYANADRLEVIAPQSILIACQKPDGSDPSDEDYSSSVNISSLLTNYKKLMPMSTYSGVDGTLFATKAVNALGMSDSLSIFYSAGIPVTKENNGYYLDIPIWFKNLSTENVQIALLIDSGATSISGTGEPDENLWKTTRVAFLSDNKTKNSLFTNNAVTDIIPVTYNDQTPRVYAPDESDTISVIKTVDSEGKKLGEQPAPLYLTDSDNLLFILPSAQNMTEGGALVSTPVKITLRIWIEGEDSYCRSEYSTEEVSIVLVFNIKD